MKQYTIRFQHKNGPVQTYRTAAPSKDAIEAFAEKRSWRILSIQEDWSLQQLLRPRLSHELLVFLFCQLSLLVHSGIPLVDAWRLLLHDVSRKKVRRRMEHMLVQMEKGTSPARAMEQCGIFPSFACHMVRTGEHAGSLEEMLQLLGDYYEYVKRQQHMLVNALAYPLFLLGSTICLFIGAVFFIVPIFETMFIQMAVPLPWPTRCILMAGAYLRQYGLMAAGCAVCVAAVLAAAWRNPQRRCTIEGWLLAIPLIRKWVLMLCWQRVSCIVAVQIKSGIPLLQTLDDAAAVVPLLWFEQCLRQLRYRLENGISVSLAVQQGQFGTAYVETMLRVGETTGCYDEALEAIAVYYGRRLEALAEGIQRIIGPVLLLGMGIVIALLMLCLLLPLFDMAAGIGTMR